MIETISFQLNGRPVELKTDGERPLLWLLRADFGLTGTKYGCGMGICGACTVLINQSAFRSCQTTLKDLKGTSVTTIEGLSAGKELHPLQKAFMEHNALQCGYCTSGMILNAYSLLLKNPEPTQAEILQGMNDNLCRCGAHQRIVQAIQSAGRQMNGGRQ
jgi:aerobic-type carbon monoxide dehydrogenase small subunit (CoxS/CutS family)